MQAYHELLFFFVYDFSGQPLLYLSCLFKATLNLAEDKIESLQHKILP